MNSPPVVVLVVDHQAPTRASLATDVEQILGDLADVDLVTDPANGAARARAIRREGALVPLAFIDGDSEDACETAIALHEVDELRPTRNVLVTSNPSLGGFDLALRRGAVHGMITRPWTIDGLTAQLTANLAMF